METNQEITLYNRHDLTITNVTKVNNFNDVLFDIETKNGKMVIEGKELDMKYYDVEKGKMNIQGKIDKIEYKDKAKQKKETSFMAKLFKWFIVLKTNY